MEYKIDERYLKVLLKAKADSIVGRVLRRIETISDIGILKTVVKELIHEECRDLQITLDAYNAGLLFSLSKKDPTQK